MIETWRVLVADRNTESRRRIACQLKKAGYEVVEADECKRVLLVMYRTHPDLILLDWSPPAKDSGSLLSGIRLFTDIPVIVMARPLNLLGRQKATELGATAFLTKPIRAKSLLARVEKQLHLAAKAAAALQIDLREHQVSCRRRRIRLSLQELKLLKILAREEGRPVPSEKIGRLLWERADRLSRQDNLKHYVWRLRRKLEADPHHPRYLQTVPGVGYRLDLAPPPTK